MFPAHTSDSTIGSPWRDMKVIDNYAYIGSEAQDHGMQIFNLERLRNMTSLQNVTPDAHYDKIGNSHNIVADEETRFIYVVGATNQSNPKYILCTGQYISPIYCSILCQKNFMLV